MLKEDQQRNLLPKILISIILISVLFISCTGNRSTEPVITTSSDSARYYYQMGMEKQARLKIDESSFYFLKALSFDPDFALANLRLAGLQTDQRIAAKYLNRAKKMYSELTAGEKLLIDATDAGLNGNQNLQKKYFKQLYDDFPGNVPYMVLYGNFLFGQSEFHEAIPVYLKAIELDPTYHQSYNQIGYAYRNINDLENASKYLKMYMEILPDEVNPLDSYAELMVKSGKFEKGLNVYLKAVKTDPKFTSANIGVGTSLTYLGRTDEARDHLLKYYQSVKSNGIRRNVNNVISATYLWDNNLQSAIKCMKKSLFISEVTENIGAQVNDLFNISQAFIEYGDSDSALTYLVKIDKAIEEGLPTGNGSLDSIITCFGLITSGYKKLLEGNYVAPDSIARVYLSKSAIKNSAGRKAAGQTLLGYSAIIKGNYEEAHQYFQEIPFNRSIDKYYRGYALEMLGQTDIAIKEYKSLINDNPVIGINHAIYYNKAKDRLRELESASITH